jgi:hypothetical protein
MVRAKSISQNPRVNQGEVEMSCTDFAFRSSLCRLHRHEEQPNRTLPLRTFQNSIRQTSLYEYLTFLFAQFRNDQSVPNNPWFELSHGRSIEHFRSTMVIIRCVLSAMERRIASDERTIGGFAATCEETRCIFLTKALVHILSLNFEIWREGACPTNSRH